MPRRCCLVSLAMPAMTAAVVGAAGPEHAGVASGILNAVRQSGGALGVAVLGSLLSSGTGPGHALNLHVPLAVAAGGYLIAVALAWATIRGTSRQSRTQLSKGGLILYRDARGPRRRDDGRRAVGAEGELVGSRAFAAR